MVNGSCFVLKNLGNNCSTVVLKTAGILSRLYLRSIFPLLRLSSFQSHQTLHPIPFGANWEIYWKCNTATSYKMSLFCFPHSNETFGQNNCPGYYDTSKEKFGEIQPWHPQNANTFWVLIYVVVITYQRGVKWCSTAMQTTLFHILPKSSIHSPIHLQNGSRWR